MEKPSAEAASSPARSIDALQALLSTGDHAALADSLRDLLRAGEGGRAVLRAFLERVSQPPFSPLRREKGLLLGVLRAVLEEPAAASRLAEEILQCTNPESGPLREVLIAWLPALTCVISDEHTDLKGILAAHLTADFSADEPGVDRRVTLRAMRELGVAPDPERLQDLLLRQDEHGSHWLAIQELGREGHERSIDILTQFVDSEPPTDELRLAVGVLSRLGTPRSETTIAKLLTSPIEVVRNEAALVYFRQGRSLSSLQLAVRFLNSELETSRRTAFLLQARSTSPAVFTALQSSTDLLDDGVRTEIEVLTR